MTESEVPKLETPLLAGVPNKAEANPAINAVRAHAEIPTPPDPTENATTEDVYTYDTYDTYDYYTYDYYTNTTNENYFNVGQLPQDLADQYVCIRPEHPGLTKSSVEPVIWGKIKARSVVVCGAATMIALAAFSQAISLSIYGSYKWLTVRDQIAALAWVDIAFGFVIMAAHGLCLFAIQQSRRPLFIFAIAVVVVATLVRLICECYLIDVVRRFPPNPLKTVHMFAATFHLVLMLCLNFLFFGACADYLNYPVANHTVKLMAEILTDICSALRNCLSNVWKTAKNLKLDGWHKKQNARARAK